MAKIVKSIISRPGPPGVGGADPETIRDTMALALVAGTNVTITPNDAANTITIAAVGGGGGGALDGGAPDSTYGGIVAIDGGTP